MSGDNETFLDKSSQKHPQACYLPLSSFHVVKSPNNESNAGLFSTAITRPSHFQPPKNKTKQQIQWLRSRKWLCECVDWISYAQRHRNELVRINKTGVWSKCTLKQYSRYSKSIPTGISDKFIHTGIGISAPAPGWHIYPAGRFLHFNAPVIQLMGALALRC